MSEKKQSEKKPSKSQDASEQKKVRQPAPSNKTKKPAIAQHHKHFDKGFKKSKSFISNKRIQQHPK